MKNKLTPALLVVAIVGVMLHMSAHAQSMYRCGSTYQDHPCDGTQKGGKLVGGIGMGGTSSSSSGSVADAICAKRGADAQKIVWAREGGAMLSQQLAKANSASERQLISDVYAIRGTSSDVRAAIEADCVATRQMAAQGYAAPDMSRGNALPPSGGENNAMGTNQNAGNSGSYDRAAQEAARKKERCSSLSTQLSSVTSQQRGGASGSTMDSLNQRNRELLQQLRTEQCQ